MKYRIDDEQLKRLATDAAFSAGLPAGAVKGYRKVFAWIVAAADERDLRRMKSLRFEKLRGDRSHQYSMRVNDQYRLIIEMERVEGGAVVVLIEVTDYH